MTGVVKVSGCVRTYSIIIKGDIKRVLNYIKFFIISFVSYGKEIHLKQWIIFKHFNFMHEININETIID